MTRKAFEEARAGSGAALGVELRAEQIALADRGGNGRGRAARWRCWPGRRRRRSCARNRHSRRSRGRSSRRSRRAGSSPCAAPVSPGPGSSLRTLPGIRPRQAVSSSSLASNSNCMPRQMPSSGLVRRGQRVAQPERVDPRHRIAGRADAGQNDPLGRCDLPPDRRSASPSAPSRSKATAIEPILP